VPTLAPMTGTRNAVVGAAAAVPPSNTEIVNGDFATPAGPGQGWTLVGDSRIDGGRALISEAADVFSGVTQAFAHDGGATALQLVLSEIALGADPRRVPDAIEIALRDEATGVPLLSVAGLSGTDALVSIQADGQVLAAPGVELEGTLLPDGRFDLSAPITVRVPLASAVDGAGYRLSVDLLGFGTRAAQAAVDDVRLLRDAPPNLRPVASPDAVGTLVDTPVLIDALANDTDPEGDAPGLTILSQPAGGTATVQAGQILFTPDAGFEGETTFTYAARDAGGDGAPATVTVTVTPPAADPRIVDPGPLAVAEGGVLEAALVGIDAGGSGSLSWALVSGPAGAALDPATGALRWQAPDGPAAQNFVVSLTDGAGRAVQRSLTVTVSDVAPVIGLSGAGAARTGAAYDVSFAIDDPGADTVSAIEIDWGDGTTTVLPGTARTASHVYAAAANVTVSITVENEDGRFAGPDLGVTVEDPVVAPRAPVVVRYDADRDGVTVVLDRAMVTPPAGAVSLEEAGGRVVAAATSVSADGLELSVTPDRRLSSGDYVLRLSDSWTARPGAGGAALDGDNDGSAGGDAALPFRVLQGVSPPLAVADSADTGFETAVTLDVLANDSDPQGRPLLATAVSQPLNGALQTLPDGRMVYTPQAGFTGEDRFSYRASNGAAASDPVEVVIQVAAPPPPPEDDGSGSGGSDGGGTDTGGTDGGGTDTGGSDGGGTDTGGSDGGGTETESTETVGTIAPTDRPAPEDKAPAQTAAGGIAPAFLGRVAASEPGLAARVQAAEATAGAAQDGGTASGGPGSGVCHAITVGVLAGQPFTLPNIVLPGGAATLALPGGAPEGLRVDWGDGTVETVRPGSTALSHSYETEGLRRVTLSLQTGDTVDRVAHDLSVGRPDPVRVLDAKMQNGRIVVTFSRAVSPDVVAAQGGIQLTLASGEAVPARAVLSEDGRTLTLHVGGAALEGTVVLRLVGSAQGLVDLLGCPIDGNGDGVLGGTFLADFDLEVIADARTGPRIVHLGGIVAAGEPQRRGALLGVPVRATGTAVALSLSLDGRPQAPEAVTGALAQDSGGKAAQPIVAAGGEAMLWLDEAEVARAEALTIEAAPAAAAVTEARASQDLLALPLAMAGVLGLSQSTRSAPRRAAAARPAAAPDSHGVDGLAGLARFALHTAPDREDPPE
jgi:hypothetical protein